MDGTKRCTKCKQQKSLECFSRKTQARDHLRHACRDCVAQRSKMYRQKPEVMERDRKRMAVFAATARGRYQLMKSRSKLKGYVGIMGLDEYRALTQSAACHYCGGELPPKGVGLDRIENSIGYVACNCVPCCQACNMMKGEVWTKAEFEQIAVVIRRLKEGRAA